jgi:hypothetical protein
VNEKKEKKLILQKQIDRNIEYTNQKLKESKEKSESKQKINHRYYNKIKNIK